MHIHIYLNKVKVTDVEPFSRKKISTYLTQAGGEVALEIFQSCNQQGKFTYSALGKYDSFSGASKQKLLESVALLKRYKKKMVLGSGVEVSQISE